ncbi:hypothetical protein WA026_004197 [Henosepilachna vigintioctopunctata]|uniref:Uncharacterized protein n=1 Tax=Henosepilachna vigintioctopunctata TaxID=420089 RepID=A0AAW1UHZ3_9CUCU
MSTERYLFPIGVHVSPVSHKPETALPPPPRRSDGRWQKAFGRDRGWRYYTNIFCANPWGWLATMSGTISLPRAPSGMLIAQPVRQREVKCSVKLHYDTLSPVSLWFKGIYASRAQHNDSVVFK